VQRVLSSNLTEPQPICRFSASPSPCKMRIDVNCEGTEAGGPFFHLALLIGHPDEVTAGLGGVGS
jgi:hypothetical protein